MIRFAALGDSFTEGIGDANPGFPHGVRGWADRVAKQLARSDPDTEYLNLAIRSRRLDAIVDEQVAPALAFRPTLISFFAGANDLLDPGSDTAAMVQRHRAATDLLLAGGATVIVFTCFAVKVSRLLEPFRGRLELYNEAVRALGLREGVVLIDHHAMREYDDPRLWCDDRMHMSSLGHKIMAARVLDALAVPRRFALDDLDPPADLGTLGRWARDRRFWREYVVPLVGRKLRGVTLGDQLSPKWPVPVRPADGLRTLEKRRRKHAVTSAP